MLPIIAALLVLTTPVSADDCYMLGVVGYGPCAGMQRELLDVEFEKRRLQKENQMLQIDLDRQSYEMDRLRKQRQQQRLEWWERD